MKFFLISDNLDTKVGMRLSGVEGVVAYTKEELILEYNKALKDKEIALLLISEKLARLAPEFIEEQKLNSSMPLIVELPDRHGSSRSEDYILDYVREAIGLKL